MSIRPEPPRVCPFCGVAMVKRSAGRDEGETFECPFCRVVIHVGRERLDSDKPAEKEGEPTRRPVDPA